MTDLTKRDDALLPCPFCGGIASTFEDYGHSSAWEVGCFSSECRVEPHVWEKTKAEAITAWNTRALPAAACEVLVKELQDTQDRANAFATKEYYTEMRAERAEAKLAKAVEVLENLADCVDLGCFCSEMQMATAMDIARATLAEIKGESQDGMG